MTFERVIVLGDTSVDGQSDAWLVQSRAAAVLPSGEIWVAQEAAIKVFADDGSFLRTIGRQGAGPLEFGEAPHPLLVDVDGHVHAFDSRNRRETVFAADGSLLREHRIDAPAREAALLPGLDRVVIHTSIPDLERINQPLHMLEQGELTQSFGQPLSGARMNSIEFRRKLGVDSAGRVYAMPEYEYRIGVFSATGKRLATVIGPALNDSPPEPGQVWVTMNQPPRSKVVDLWVDDRWRLWIMLEVVESAWQDAVKEVRSATGELVIHPASNDWADVYDTRVDVIDLATLTRVASGLLDELAFEFGHGPILFENYEAQSGAPQLMIRRVRF
jgi:hypothetical protein